MQISLSEARALFLRQQGLPGQPKQAGIAACQQTIEQLGYVQIDAIHRIERAHHHILWSRQPDYQTEWLNQLLAQGQIFEYWGHAASYLPLKDYRYYLPRMQGFLERSSWAQGHLPTAKPLFAEILSRIAAEGPLSASDFKSEQRKGGWWNWKPAKVALELLYWQGELMVCRRQGFKKVYQLREAFLPATLDTRVPDTAEIAQFQITKALQAFGVASASQIQRFLALSTKSDLARALQTSLESGQIQALQIEGLAATYYALPALLNAKPARVKPSNQLQILSPFDAVIIQRDRLLDLFGFSYIFEAYVPAAKRQHGYFVLPVLGPDGFVSRLDCKADRSQKTLQVLNRLDQPGLQIDPIALDHVLQAFAAFNGCEQWQYSQN